MGQRRDLLAEDQARSIRAAGIRAQEKRSTHLSNLKNAEPGLLNALGGLPTSSGARVNQGSAMTLPVVHACVGILADMVGLVPCKVFRKTADNSREEAKEHPANALIAASPNGHHTSVEFRRFLQTGVGLGGNGYARVYRDQYYQPGELQPLLPIEVRVEKLKNRRIVYHVEGERDPLTRADIVHVYGLSMNGFTGVSPVAAARESIGLGLIQREQVGRMFSNGAQFPGYLSTAQNLQKVQMDLAKETWEKEQSGAMNAGKTPLFANGWEYKTVQGQTAQDAEFLESRKFERSEIAMLYRVPEVLIGSTDKTSSWGSGIEQLNLGFLNFCLNPWLKTWEDALGITLLTTKEIVEGYYFKFNRGALLQAAMEAQAKFFREMRDIGAYSVNDVRRKLEENDLPDNIGDDYRLPFNGSGGTATEKTTTQPAAA